MKHAIGFRAGIVLAACFPATLSAATYVGTHDVGAGSVHFRITTDDTVGVLSRSNVLDWTISMQLAGVARTMDPANSSLNFFLGTALNATASGLYFDFGGSGLVNWDQSENRRDNGLCLVSNLAGYTCNLPSGITMNVEGNLASSQPAGNYLLGVSNPLGVPEPATWLELVMGLAAVGGAMRGRPRSKTATRQPSPEPERRLKRLPSPRRSRRGPEGRPSRGRR